MIIRYVCKYLKLKNVADAIDKNSKPKFKGCFSYNLYF